jgi:hypothetical protein
VDRRFRRYSRRLIAAFPSEALSRGLTTEEFAAEFVARFGGPLPAALRR